jgi:hypothetical protein
MRRWKLDVLAITRMSMGRMPAPPEVQFQKSWDAWKAWAKLEEAEIAANDGLRRLHSRQRDRHELRGTLSLLP